MWCHTRRCRSRRRCTSTCRSPTCHKRPRVRHGALAPSHLYYGTDATHAVPRTHTSPSCRRRRCPGSRCRWCRRAERGANRRSNRDSTEVNRRSCALTHPACPFEPTRGDLRAFSCLLAVLPAAARGRARPAAWCRRSARSSEWCHTRRCRSRRRCTSTCRSPTCHKRPRVRHGALAPSHLYYGTDATHAVPRTHTSPSCRRRRCPGSRCRWCRRAERGANRSNSALVN